VVPTEVATNGLKDGVSWRDLARLHLGSSSPYGAEYECPKTKSCDLFLTRLPGIYTGQQTELTQLIITDIPEQTNKFRGLQSASELYRLSNRHLLAKFSADFCG
jgi:hypothetical protein